MKMGLNFSKIVKENGHAIMLIGVFVIMLDKFSQTSGIGTAAQTTLNTGVTTISDILSWVSLVILFAIMIYFIKQMSSGKGGFSA